MVIPAVLKTVRRTSSKARSKALNFGQDILDASIEDATRFVWKHTKKAARLINKNWRSRQGSLLLEMPPNQITSYFSARKRRPNFGNIPARKRLATIAKYNARRGVRTGSRIRFAKRRYRIPRLLRLHRNMSNAVAMRNALTFRRMGENTHWVTGNSRSFFKGRIYNWFCGSANNWDSGSGTVSFQVVDFGNAPVPPGGPGVAQSDNGDGFLRNLALNEVTASSGGAWLQRVGARLNLFNTGDPNITIKMAPAVATYHWKNNSGIQVEMYFYVFQALQDIPWDSNNNKPKVSFEDAWLRSLDIPTGNIDKIYTTSWADNSLENMMTCWPTDNPAGLRPYYRILKMRKVVFQPGDEAIERIVQKGRILTMQNIRERQEECNNTIANNTEFTQNGFYMLKGDLATFSMLRGGIIHEVNEEGEITVAGTAEVDPQKGASLDQIVTKSFKGCILPGLQSRQFIYRKDLTEPENDQIQTIPSYTKVQQ